MNESCESYVINKLREVEKENTDLKEKVKDLVDENNRLSGALVTIKDILSRNAVVKQTCGSKYIDMSIWARYWEPDQLADYETLLSLVNIPTVEKEEETEVENGDK